MLLGRLALLLVILGGPARADNEQAASLSIDYMTFSVPGEAMNNMPPPSLSPTVGFGLAGSYERAIGTDLLFRAEAAIGGFYGGAQKPDQGNWSGAVLGDVGAAYRFDISKYVPYGFVGLGGVYSGGGPIEDGGDLVLVFGAGCDRLSTRDRSFGLELRVASFGGDITVLTIGLRGTRRWGFF